MTQNIPHVSLENGLKLSVKTLEWSVQSTDLNPIEYLWKHLKKKLTGHETEPRGIREL